MIIMDAIEQLERCETQDELRATFQKLIQNFGFSGYSFVDVNKTTPDDFLVVTTVEESWIDTYVSNQFLTVDPMFPAARRNNLPFFWKDIPLPRRLGKKKPGGIKVMEAARDHGFKEGLVVPYHYVDTIGRMNSAVCGFFWKNNPHDLIKQEKTMKVDLHILTIYWAQKSYELHARNGRVRVPLNVDLDHERPSLTDRERDVLTWAARGKTLPETASILALSKDTIDNYIRKSLLKLNAHSKTQAVAKAIMLGLIDL